MIREVLKRPLTSVLDLLGFSLVSRNRHGLEVSRDISRTSLCVRTVFDVGANVGLTVRQYLATFPEARVHAFEPVSGNFEQLEEITGDGRLVLNQVALADAPGTARMFLSSTDPSHHSLVAPPSINCSEELVRVTTVDEYCIKHEVERIDFMKIDTEGADLLVLRGAQRNLSQRRISFVLVETCFQEGRRHVAFQDFVSFLEPFGYRLFGLYDQCTEWDGKASLQYANACFVLPGIRFRDE